MKMMRKNWKDRKGVSPVIATILMVAITVVLAAVLYVMVMGFGGDSSSTPAGQITNAERVTVETQDGYKLTFSSFSPETKFSDLKVSFDSQTYKLSEKAGSIEGGVVAKYKIVVNDLAGDGTVSQGDSITITRLASTTEVPGTTLSIVHGPSGGLIAERTLAVIAAST